MQLSQHNRPFILGPAELTIMKGIIRRMQNPFTSVTHKVKSAIREKAISRARTRIVIAQKQPEEFTPEELEVIVQEEEAQIYANIREKGLLAVLAVLGLNFFG